MNSSCLPGDQYGGPPHQWQHYAATPSDNVVLQKPPAYASKPLPAPLFINSSGGSGSNYSGGENPHRPPSPGISSTWTTRMFV